MFEVGAQYRRRDLHREFGGQEQSGISTPARHPVVFLFTGESGEQHGYKDGWTGDGTFSFSGQGQSGDMVFQHGNAAIRDHAANGKDLHLFENVGGGMVKYLGQMVYGGYQIVPNQPDSKGTLRDVIQFHLVEHSAIPDGISTHPQYLQEVPGDYDAARLFDAHDDLETTSQEAKARAQLRATATQAAVLKRANGICEGCGQFAPFLAENGQPYLEPHHVRRWSDGGPDDPNYVIALCPNCHRHAHMAADSETFNNWLKEKLATIVSR